MAGSESTVAAIGITMMGTGLGAFILPPIVEFVISNYGWRMGYRASDWERCAFHCRLFSLCSARTPKRKLTAQAMGRLWGITRSQAMRTNKFWLLGAVMFVTVIVLTGLLSNFPRIMGEQGFALGVIAGIASVMEITVVIGRLAVGIPVDKFWAPGVAAVFFMLPTIALLIILRGTGINRNDDRYMIGLAAGAELDLLAYLTSTFFDQTITRRFSAPSSPFSGGGIAPPLFAVAQATGGYATMLSAAVGML